MKIWECYPLYNPLPSLFKNKQIYLEKNASKVV